MAHDFTNPAAICPGALQFERLDGEDCLHGLLRIGQINFHVTAIKVTDDEEGCQEPTLDPHNRYEDLLRLDEAAPGFRTVTIPGHPGDWAIFMSPFGR